ncbi:hypothetical protein J7E97_02805 [Streptomyces sp. ISL-66]|uniref:hypothetical protein n=1 Tax=Streptomyces sp. ISL-66 TaxID=2819186 RepID=UPI001BE6FF74|nr:hypothetical protein [Streptomyces sp. ISL-66]MBT2466823.1 hypothetical protein [Streptomyces sp. ISL-66]
MPEGAHAGYGRDQLVQDARAEPDQRVLRLLGLSGRIRVQLPDASGYLGITVHHGASAASGNVRPVAASGTHSRRTGRKPKCVQYEGFRPARREHAPDAAP